jgi:Protein of unknown function (DUF2924)
MRRKDNERGVGGASLAGAAPDEPSAPSGGGDVSKTATQNLDHLGPELLRRRWRSAMGRSAPASMSRQLTIRILSWREQVARVGDLDAKTLATLAAALQADQRSGGPSPSAPSPPGLRPGSVLVREHGRVLHRVMVLDQSYAWNGRTFASLSSVARAITGTNWNGRRFFGLDRPGGGAKAVSQPKRRAPEPKRHSS